jgi:hypothetical protein
MTASPAYVLAADDVLVEPDDPVEPVEPLESDDVVPLLVVTCRVSAVTTVDELRDVL